jgi:hypothetical protein
LEEVDQSVQVEFVLALMKVSSDHLGVEMFHAVA